MQQMVWRLQVTDVCKCHNFEQCPKWTSCYRALAKTGEVQTVADFYNPDKECDHYWEVYDAVEVSNLNWRLRDEF